MAHLSLGSLSSLRLVPSDEVVIFSEAFRQLRADLPFSLLVPGPAPPAQEC